METVRKIASYICDKYQRTFGSRIDEMKLHKLLYFTQRECLIQKSEPMFAERFQAWKYGPVMVQIRKLYKDDMLHVRCSKSFEDQFRDVFDKVFEQYASKDSWSLSYLTHGEYSWQQARKGVPAGEGCDKLIDTEDIKIDAERIRIRRLLLKKKN